MTDETTVELMADANEAERPAAAELPAADASQAHALETAAPAAAELPDAAETPEAVDAPAPAESDETGSAAPVASELTGPRTVGRVIADALRAAGVRYAFTVPGESFLGILDVLGDAGIRVVATRHEGAAAFMAEAHGQLTGRPAVCLATRAVGSSNLAIGIHTARQDSTPMFAIVGQVERAVQGHEAFQEIDQVGTIGGLAKWATEVRRPEDVPGVLAEAIRQATTGRPGPVLVSVPEDVLDQEVDGALRVELQRTAVPRATDDEIRSVIELLASARRPVILAGGGILRARTSTELLRFAELLQVPVIASWRRPDVISNDHPLYLGMAGFGAPSWVAGRLIAADALLVIGCRLNEPTTAGYTLPSAETRWAHVDMEPRVGGDLPAPELAVVADARAFLRAANERLVGRAVLDAERVAARQAHNSTDRDAWEAASVVDGGEWTGAGVHPGRVVSILREVLPDDAIVTTDAGNFAGWAGRGFRFRRPGTFLGPTSGAMGYGLPAAIAAALVHRDRPVVAMVGDGGLAMSMAELETAVREGVRVVVLAFDNERYGTIRMWQERRGSGAGIATELGPVDFAAIARAMGARGIRVERDGDVEGALRQALAETRPSLLQLVVDRSWVSVDEPATA